MQKKEYGKEESPRFSMNEVIEIFRREAEEIAGNKEEALQYARIAVQDFKTRYGRRIR